MNKALFYFHLWQAERKEVLLNGQSTKHCDRLARKCVKEYRKLHLDIEPVMDKYDRQILKEIC